MNLRKKHGITLISLVITIVVLLILVSIATYSGINVINSSKFTTFTAELKIMQSQVNEIYQKYKDDGTVKIDETTYSGEEILNIGQEITDSIKTQADKVFAELAADTSAGITSQEGYRYWDKEDVIKKLGIEGVEQSFFVNIKKRSIVSYYGFNYDNKMYYTLNQLPNNLYNVEYQDKNVGQKPTFDIKVEPLIEQKWRITISNIQFNGYIDKWQVKYQLEGKDYWNTSEDLSFIVTETGIYTIRIENGNIESDNKKEIIINNSNIKLTKDMEGEISVDRQITGITQYINFNINGLEKYNVSVEPKLPFAIDSNGEYNFRFDVTDEQGITSIINKKVTINSYVDNPDYWLDLDGTAHIELTNINQNDICSANTIATKIRVNKEQQQSKTYMGIYGNHRGTEGLARQFTVNTTTIMGIDYTPYYDKWTDFIVTYDKNLKQYKGYINGELKVTLNDINVLPYEGFNIGTSYLVSDRQMIGQITGLKIWDKVLTDKEVAQIDLLRDDINVRKEDIYCNINLRSEDDIKNIGTFVGSGYTFNKVK